MLYTYVDSHKVRLLYLKKSLLGQHEVSFFDKRHTADLLKNGEISNLDLFASAIKEGLNGLGITGSEEVTLVLPQDSFEFLTFQVPADYSSGSLQSYVADRVKSELGTDLTEYTYDVLASESDTKQEVMCFAIKADTVASFNEALKLLNLKLVSILPESLCVFKLFEKTLRREKKENILYVSCDEGEVTGYLYDSLGLASKKRWVQKAGDPASLPKILKDKAKEFEDQNTKLNRIILSGPKSEGIRQDTFTKQVGVWTNPLKRIIPHFYQEYLKMLVTQADASFPILVYDVCFGAFVFSQENKKFNILKNYSRKLSRGVKIPFLSKKALIFILIFGLSFVASFYALIGLSKAGVMSSIKLPSLPQQTTPTPTEAPQPKVSPTPAFTKEELRIKVLNGSGTAGKASELKEVLNEKGYEEILTGNADSFDFEQTVIQAKKSVKGAAETVKKDLSDVIEDPKIEALDEKETSDVIIIIGTDFK